MKTINANAHVWKKVLDLQTQWSDAIDEWRAGNKYCTMRIKAVSDLSDKAEEFLADFQPTSSDFYADAPQPDGSEAPETRTGYLFERNGNAVEFIFWQKEGKDRVLNEIRDTDLQYAYQSN